MKLSLINLVVRPMIVFFHSFPVTRPKKFSPENGMDVGPSIWKEIIPITREFTKFEHPSIKEFSIRTIQSPISLVRQKSRIYTTPVTHNSIPIVVCHFLGKFINNISHLPTSIEMIHIRTDKDAGYSAIFPSNDTILSISEIREQKVTNHQSQLHRELQVSPGQVCHSRFVGVGWTHI